MIPNRLCNKMAHSGIFQDPTGCLTLGYYGRQLRSGLCDICPCIVNKIQLALQICGPDPSQIRSSSTDEVTAEKLTHAPGIRIGSTVCIAVRESQSTAKCHEYSPPPKRDRLSLHTEEGTAVFPRSVAEIRAVQGSTVYASQLGVLLLALLTG